MSFDLIVPLFNEIGNIPTLVGAIHACGLPRTGMRKAILVDNGSVDDSSRWLRENSPRYPWILPLRLETNQQYGGGLLEGFRHATSPFLAYMPGDNQVDPGALVKAWEHLQRTEEVQRHRTLIKGRRDEREDPLSLRFTSLIYTGLANQILGTDVADINGLPKLFHRSLLDALPSTKMVTFTLDAQLISVATQAGWNIKEFPVAFHARRAGVSSWSKKRLRVYRETLSHLWTLRRLQAQASVPFAFQKS